ncbi:MAG: TrmH family RNA methyltransferase [Aureispira sp.]
MKHPRDQFLTVYGRKPVLELLAQPQLDIAKVVLARKAKGDIIKQILTACEERQVPVLRLEAAEVSRLSKHPKQDQGVAADVHTPYMDDALQVFQQGAVPAKCSFLALDGITTPANVGLIIRTATAMGLDGIILPRKGSAKLDAFVIKASAGVVFKSRLLKCERLTPILRHAKQHGFAIYALSGEQGNTIYQADFAPRSIFVLGNESAGVSKATEELTTAHFSIPMAKEVESLNVACAAAVVCSEILRRN